MKGYCWWDLNNEGSYLFGSVLYGLGSADETRASSGEQADLLTRTGEAADSSGLPQVLVVTSSVGVVDGVHAHTGHAGESLAQPLELVEQHSRLHNRLLVAAAARDDAHSGAAGPWDRLPGARGQTDARLGAVL